MAEKYYIGEIILDIPASVVSKETTAHVRHVFGFHRRDLPFVSKGTVAYFRQDGDRYLVMFRNGDALNLSVEACKGHLKARRTPANELEIDTVIGPDLESTLREAKAI